MTERDCAHGNQARVCPHCEAAITIDELRTALADRDERLRMLAALSNWQGQPLTEIKPGDPLPPAFGFFVNALAAAIRDTPEARNYLEFGFSGIADDPDAVWNVIIVRPDGKSPGTIAEQLRADLADRDATIKALREALSTALAMKDSALRRAMAAEGARDAP